MKKHLALLMLVLVCAVPCAQTYKPLDGHDPVLYNGASVSYAGEEIALCEHTLFVDMQLSDRDVESNPYVFNDFRKAAEHFIDGTAEKPMQVYIAPGVYWIDNPDFPEVLKEPDGSAPFGITIRCENLHLTGLARDARNVVLASARGQTQGAVGNFTMFNFFGNGLEVRNLTMGNFCNVDLEFPLRPELGRPKRSAAITQAHVAYTHGDRIYAENVHFISRLNMNPLSGGRRILFNRCHLEMTDDALAPTGVYLHCTFGLYGQKPFYCSDSCGAVFMDCDFDVCHDNPCTFFCKAVGRVSLVDCRFHAGRPLSVGWTSVSPAWLRCYQYNVTLDGRPCIVGADNPSNTVFLEGKPMLAAFRLQRGDSVIYNVWNLLRGTDDWDPLGQRGMIAELERNDGLDYSNIASCLSAEPHELSLRAGDAPVEIVAALKRHSNFPLLGSPVSWRLQSGYEKDALLEPTGAYSCRVASLRDSDEAARCTLTGVTAEGHECSVGLTLLPKELPPPDFDVLPTLRIERGLATLEYSLDLEGRRDESLVTWYRAKDRSGSGAVPVAVSRFGKPLRQYSITQDDCGYYLMAVIEAKHLRSKPGKAVSVVSSRPVTMKQAVRTDRIDTDFMDFPTANQPDVIPGFWTVGSYKPIDTQPYDWQPDHNRDAWIYGEGFNGAKGTGLLQDQKGARLMYTPVKGKYGDMEIVLDVDPTKTAGQGFGSATGQYMDVCIKFDTGTLTGYALRIERTVKYSKAVDFSLVRYDNGVVTPLTAPVSSVCYRTGCRIVLRAAGSLLSAHVDTATDVVAYDPALTTSVDLEAKIVPNRFGGVAIQHTGSCGESTTMLHRLQVTLGN